MAWNGEMVTIVRHIVNDADEDSYTYTDEKIEKVILVAARQVISEVRFPNTYTVSVEGCSLSPDPTLDASLDNPFVHLVCIKAACIIIGGEFKKQSMNAISVTNSAYGNSSINMTGVATNLKSLHEDLCKKFEEAKFVYATSRNPAGHAIFSTYGRSPYRRR